jgi:hypothetical protein
MKIKKMTEFASFSPLTLSLVLLIRLFWKELNQKQKQDSLGDSVSGSISNSSFDPALIQQVLVLISQFASSKNSLSPNPIPNPNPLSESELPSLNTKVIYIYIYISILYLNSPFNSL